MKITTILLTVTIACFWAIIGVLLFDCMEFEATSDGPDTRWGHITNFKLMMAVITSSSLLWLAIVFCAFRNPKIVFILAALFSPILGAILFSGLYWIMTFGEVQFIGLALSLILVFIGGFFFSLPVSMLTALSCFLVIRNDIKLRNSILQNKMKHTI